MMSAPLRLTIAMVGPYIVVMTWQDEYQEKYYEENRERIARRRKELYHNDPEYREKVLKAARDRRRALRKDCPPRDPGAPREYRVRVGDEISTIQLYMIGRAAELAGMKKSRLTTMLGRGRVPPTPYVFSGNRLFSAEMIQAIKEVDDMDLTGAAFTDEVVRRWRENGVPSSATVWSTSDLDG